MSNKRLGLIIGALVAFILLVGVVYMALAAQNNGVTVDVGSAPARSASDAAADPALCGNGVVDAGEACDIFDPLTMAGCQQDCTKLPYTDPVSCLTERQKNCVDANNDPVADYYGCIDAEYAYCSGLTYQY